MNYKKEFTDQDMIDTWPDAIIGMTSYEQEEMLHGYVRDLLEAQQRIERDRCARILEKSKMPPNAPYRNEDLTACHNTTLERAKLEILKPETE